MDFKDGASGFMRIVEEIGVHAFLQLQWDGFGTVRDFRFDQRGNFQAPGKVYAGSGASHMQEDGNMYGPVWNGYLNSWLMAQINALNIALDSQTDASINDNNTNWVNNQISAFINNNNKWVINNSQTQNTGNPGAG